MKTENKKTKNKKNEVKPSKKKQKVLDAIKRNIKKLEALQRDYEVYMKNRAIRATNNVFVEWVEENIEELCSDEGMGVIAGRDRYLDEAGLQNITFSTKKFIKYIKMYCDACGYDFIPLSNTRPRGFRLKKNSKHDALVGLWA